MLTAVPRSWFSWDFRVMDGTRAVGDIDMSCWREKGVITIAGADYRVYPEGLMCGDFILASEDKLLALLSPRRLFTRRAAVELPESLPL